MYSLSRYVPIVPMILINGSLGIGTGYSSTVPNFNPRDVVDNIRHLMRDEELEPLEPWYRGFRGTFEKNGQSYTVRVDAFLLVTYTSRYAVPTTVWMIPLLKY